MCLSKPSKIAPSRFNNKYSRVVYFSLLIREPNILQKQPQRTGNIFSSSVSRNWLTKLSSSEKSRLSTGSSLTSSASLLVLVVFESGRTVFTPSSASFTSSYETSASGSFLLAVDSSPSGSFLALKSTYLLTSSPSSPPRSSSSTKVSFFSVFSFKNLNESFHLHWCYLECSKPFCFLPSDCPQNPSHSFCPRQTPRALLLRS